MKRLFLTSAVNEVADHSLRLAFIGVGILPLIAFFLFRYSPFSKKIPVTQ